MYSQQNTSTYLTKEMFNSDKGYLKKIRLATLLNYLQYLLHQKRFTYLNFHSVLEWI